MQLFWFLHKNCHTLHMDIAISMYPVVCGTSILSLILKRKPGNEAKHWVLEHVRSLVPRLFLPPVFDCLILQVVKSWNGLGTIVRRGCIIKILIQFPGAVMPLTVSSPGVRLLQCNVVFREELLINITGVSFQTEYCTTTLSILPMHPCGILPLTQARPKMPCIYTSDQG